MLKAPKTGHGKEGWDDQVIGNVRHYSQATLWGRLQ